MATETIILISLITFVFNTIDFYFHDPSDHDPTRPPLRDCLLEINKNQKQADIAKDAIFESDNTTSRLITPTGCH